MNRNTSVRSIRPKIEAEDAGDQQFLAFQNDCLRPILKFQNSLFIKRFIQDPFTVKSNFIKMNTYDQRQYISHRLKSDKKLQVEYLGMVTGLMTDDEFQLFIEYRDEVKKRVIIMLIKRLQDECVS